ncbi:MAG: hypothetical protein V1703_05065 [Candidatus Altiarchaeota archaeon]
MAPRNFMIASSSPNNLVIVSVALPEPMKVTEVGRKAGGELQQAKDALQDVMVKKGWVTDEPGGHSKTKTDLYFDMIVDTDDTTGLPTLYIAALGGKGQSVKFEKSHT